MGNRIITKEQRAEVAKLFDVDVSQIELAVKEAPVRTVMRRISTSRIYGDIETKETEVYYPNILTVGAGTDGAEGSDTGDHDAGTYFKLEDGGCTNWSVMVKLHDGKIIEYEPEGVVFNLVGASESLSFCEALEFAAKTLRKQLKDNAAE